jgi:murein DD-endopeptidase MepM/ murein hydrolase activator NlpD
MINRLSSTERALLEIHCSKYFEGTEWLERNDEIREVRVLRKFAVLSAASLVLLAATPAFAETIHACITAGEGTLYGVGIGTPSNCKRGDQYINWNQEGVAGQDEQIRVMRHEYPQDAFQITSDFKSRYNMSGQKRKAPHSGIDILAPEGTPVLAIADGVVFRSRLNRKFGEEIKIKHAYGTPDEIRAQYIHLDARLVEVGDKVRRGQIIGLVGKTGSPDMLTSGLAHLHMALWSTSLRGDGGECCKKEDPHELWYDGSDAITVYRPGKNYTGNPHRFTYPIPGKTDLDYFQKKLASLTQ